jgi:cysteine-rich repeat protein
MMIRSSLRLAATTGLLLAVAATARAHDTAVDLMVWGNFGTETVRCQRSIARAAALCTGRALAARTLCLGAQLHGDECATAEMDARVEAARTRALDQVEATCTPEQLQTLRYVDMSDALTDVIDVCRRLDTAAVTAAYGPAMFGGTIAAAEGSELTCLDTTARASARLLRYAMRSRQLALDEIASAPMELPAKLAVLERSTRRIAHATQVTKRRILTVCPNDDFEYAYERGIDEFLARIAGQADCLAESVYVQNAVTCPAAQCGDGMQVVPQEECDDGNAYEGDGCRADCVKTECDVFPTTYDLIQKAIFENHGCTNDLCHGAARQGQLDLRPGVSYASLLQVNSNSAPGRTRLWPGDKDKSLLWINLAARTLPDQYDAPVRGMPLEPAPALSTDELEAVRLWIESSGAARDANNTAAANLLKACVPEPEPVEIEPLDPPSPDEGVQLHMPEYTLKAHSETEVCFASYYDLTGKIPAQFLSADGKRFRYKSVEIRQDPLSHHLIVDIFRGTTPANDPVWGVYKCRGGEQDGTVCDPLDLDSCGAGQCATDPDPTAIACIGFGPQMGLGTLTSGGFAFAQETTANFLFPSLVYGEIPVRGVILWNSHAFNLTRRDGVLEAWVNIFFPELDEQQFQAQQIFNTSKIFWTEQVPIPPPALPAFADMEVCQIHEFSENPGGFLGGNSLLRPNETAHLFEVSGHMHEHGTRFQILRGRFTCTGGANAGEACSPFVPEMCPGATCVDDGGRDPQQALLYTNFVYNDPVILRFEQPIVMSGSAPLADRTFTYCGHYDNGKAPNIQKVKRRSTSPPGGMIFDLVTIGGPCAVSQTRCIGGPQHNQLCNGNDAACESSPGAGDGDCDACPLTGGFRTQDEMFIMFGNFWVTRN